jgi:hypothetical protein
MSILTCSNCFEDLFVDGHVRECSDCLKEGCICCISLDSDGESRFCEQCKSSRLCASVLQIQEEECELCLETVLPIMLFSCPLCCHRRCYKCVNRSISDTDAYCKECSSVCCVRGCDILVTDDMKTCGSCNINFMICADHKKDYDIRCDHDTCLKYLCPECAISNMTTYRARHLSLCNDHISKCVGCSTNIYKDETVCNLCENVSCNSCKIKIFPNRTDICRDHLKNICPRHTHLTVIENENLCTVRDCYNLCCKYCHIYKPPGEYTEHLYCEKHWIKCKICHEKLPSSEYVRHINIPGINTENSCINCLIKIKGPLDTFSMVWERIGKQILPKDIKNIIASNLYTDLMKQER